MFFGNKHQPTTDNNDDRRAIKRRHLIYYLRVWDLKTDQLLGHIVDINTGGFMLISEKPIEPKQTFGLEIHWNTPDETEIRIQFQAISRWSSNDINKAFFDTGFELVDQVEDVLKPIREMIEEYGFQN
ncbi:MAG: PilZ domain-containing protein [Gammaproteobacteria bacterium]|nr:PilZ domain-containing protein [Gammaproteobacteria bacterium]